MAIFNEEGVSAVLVYRPCSHKVLVDSEKRTLVLEEGYDDMLLKTRPPAKANGKGKGKHGKGQHSGKNWQEYYDILCKKRDKFLGSKTAKLLHKWVVKHVNSSPCWQGRAEGDGEEDAEDEDDDGHDSS